MGEIKEYSSPQIIAPNELAGMLARAETVSDVRQVKEKARQLADVISRVSADAYPLATEYAALYLEATAKAGKQLGEGKRGAPKGNVNAGKQTRDGSGLNLKQEEDKRRTERKLARCDDVISDYVEQAKTKLEIPNIAGCLRFAQVPGDVHVSYNSGNNEWYTPEEYIAAAHSVMGGIDLDPASSAEANEIVKAKRIYTEKSNGLIKQWKGRVWMNPPYSSDLIGQFCGKLNQSVKDGDVSQAITLTNNATETAWFAELLENASAIVFPQSRVRFWSTGGSLGAPLQGQAVIYIGGAGEKFIEEFSRFGWGAYLAE